MQKKRIAPNVYELKFTKPDGFTFTAGQFILLDVPLLSDPKDIQARAYSIASTNVDDELLFVIKMVPNGRASTWIESRLDIGTQIIMKGPFGAFTLDNQTKKDYLFIATGTGIAPILSQVQWALIHNKDTRPMHVVFGVYTQEDMFWEKEFRLLEDRYPNLTVHASFFKGGENWHGKSGPVQEQVESIISDFSAISVYLCGSPNIVQELKTRCLTEWNIPPQDLHQEAYV